MKFYIFDLVTKGVTWNTMTPVGTTVFLLQLRSAGDDMTQSYHLIFTHWAVNRKHLHLFSRALNIIPHSQILEPLVVPLPQENMFQIFQIRTENIISPERNVVRYCTTYISLGQTGFCGFFWGLNPIYKIVHMGKDIWGLKQLMKKWIF